MGNPLVPAAQQTALNTVQGQFLGRAASNDRLQVIAQAVAQGKITPPNTTEIEYKLVKREEDGTE